MMMPVAFNDNPYVTSTNPEYITTNIAPPTPGRDRANITPQLQPELPRSPEPESQWDWNKMFIPMQQAMQGVADNFKDKQNPDFIHDADFKYASPFKYTSPFKPKPTATQNGTESRLNPNASSFKANFAGAPLAALNPNANSFKMPFMIPSTAQRVGKEEESKLDMFSKVDIVCTPESAGKGKPKKKSPQKKTDYNNDETILAMHGYKKIRKLQNCLQGIYLVFYLFIYLFILIV